MLLSALVSRRRFRSAAAAAAAAAVAAPAPAHIYAATAAGCDNTDWCDSAGPPPEGLLSQAASSSYLDIVWALSCMGMVRASE